jgi:hypothetical protein
VHIERGPAEIQTSTYGHLINDGMKAPLPAVFFRHLRLIALPVPEGKFGALFKNFIFSLL